MLERLLFIVPGFPADEADTSCVPAVYTFVRGIARLHPHVEVRIVTMQYPYAADPYEWHGIRVSPAGGANRGGLGKIATWRRAWRRVVEYPADIIHSFWIGEATLLGALAARYLRCAHVATIGGRELRRPTPYSILLRQVPFRLVAGSVHASETAVGTLGRHADTVIPLGLSLDDIPSNEVNRDIDILFAGSLIPLKRADEVVIVARALPCARVVIAGDGPERGSLEQAAPPNLSFIGSRRREEILQLMSRSKVLLHPSEYESQGYVFLEALASGMHVVCRDVGFPGDSQKVHLCDTTDEMVAVTRRLLGGPLSFDPVGVPTTHDTVRAYTDLYLETLRRAERR